MSTDKGYIKLFRSVRDNWIWNDKECPAFDKFHAWVDLLMMVNHKENKVMFNGKVITVGVGSRITSMRKLAERWGWSVHKVSNFLNELERDQMIVQRRDSRKTLVTIVNYGFYQSYNGTQGTPKEHSGNTEGTHREHSGNQTIHYKDITEGIENNEEGVWTLKFDESEDW